MGKSREAISTVTTKKGARNEAPHVLINHRNQKEHCAFTPPPRTPTPLKAKALRCWQTRRQYFNRKNPTNKELVQTISRKH